METNTPRHCIHGVLENCCNVCDKDIDPCPSCKEHEKVEDALAGMIREIVGKNGREVESVEYYITEAKRWTQPEKIVTTIKDSPDARP